MGSVWSIKFFTPLVTAAFCLAAAGAAPTDSPNALARQARRAAQSGEYTRAYLLYSQAAALRPKNRKYRGLMEGMQGRSAAQTQPVLQMGSDSAEIGRAHV